jgi:hypothetical protein
MQDLRTKKSLHFTFIENVLSFPLLQKDNFTGYKIFKLQLFYLNL